MHLHWEVLLAFSFRVVAFTGVQWLRTHCISSIGRRFSYHLGLLHSIAVCIGRRWGVSIYNAAASDRAMR